MKYIILLVQEDIHFVPAISGAGRGFGKILLGAALIGGAFLVPAGTGLTLMLKVLEQLVSCKSKFWLIN